MKGCSQENALRIFLAKCKIPVQQATAELRSAGTGERTLRQAQGELCPYAISC